MKIVIVLILYFFIVVFDFIPLVKKRMKKGKWFYLSTLIITFIVIMLDSMSIYVPSPALLIKFIIDSVL